MPGYEYHFVSLQAQTAGAGDQFLKPFLEMNIPSGWPASAQDPRMR
jgi:hypothetical protein